MENKDNASVKPCGQPPQKRADAGACAVLADAVATRGSAIALGVFDGVHVGHRALIGAMVADAGERGLRSVVYTFDVNPLSLLRPESAPPALMTCAEKVRAVRSLGVEHVEVTRFTPELARMELNAFLLLLIARFGMRHLVVGHDARIGRGGVGDPATLALAAERYGFTLRVVEPVRRAGGIVSSTHARALLSGGELLKLRRLAIGCRISGAVERGLGVARELAHPTMNVRIPQGKALPALGVYACFVRVRGKWLPGAANLGVRPTVRAQGAMSLEVFAFGDVGDAYGCRVAVRLVRHLRPEMKFPSLNALQAQMGEDVKKAKCVLRPWRLIAGGFGRSVRG